MLKNVKTLKGLQDGPGADVIEYMSQMAEQPEQARRYFAVGFKDADVRVVYPKYGDPLSYEVQIEASKEASYSVKT